MSIVQNSNIDGLDQYITVSRNYHYYKLRVTLPFNRCSFKNGYIEGPCSCTGFRGIDNCATWNMKNEYLS